MNTMNIPRKCRYPMQPIARPLSGRWVNVTPHWATTVTTGTPGLKTSGFAFTVLGIPGFHTKSEYPPLIPDTERVRRSLTG